MTERIDPQLQSAIDNLPKKTGKSLAEWFKVIAAAGADQHGPIMKVLKDEHGLTHGYANTISILYRQQAAGGPPSEDNLVAEQYAGPKAGLRPLYEAIVAAAKGFGSDVEIAPKKTYVSLRRKKQFAIVQATTRTRVDLGFNLKGVEGAGRLEAGIIFGGMCTHKVGLSSLAEADAEVVAWLKQAYDQS